ncbi:MAG: aldehyde dehydrogenase, partial [Armatimonadota bacterium]
SRIIVDRAIEPEFTKRYVENVRRIKIGDGMDANTFMGPLIEPGAMDKWEHHNTRAKEEGAQVLVDGKRLTEGAHAD